MKKIFLLWCVLGVCLSLSVGRAIAEGRWVVCMKLQQPHDPGDKGKCFQCALADPGNQNFLNPACPGSVCQNSPGAMKRAFRTRKDAVEFIQTHCGCWYTTGDEEFRIPPPAVRDQRPSDSNPVQGGSPGVYVDPVVGSP